jgi:hypothetical protein
MDKNITPETVEASGAEVAVPEAKSTPSSSPAMQFHCPFRQASLLQQALLPDKMRVAFFLGAGCPTAIRVPDGSGTKPLIPDIAGLTERISTAFGAKDDLALKTAFEAVTNRLKGNGRPTPNIEEILSHIRLLLDVVGTGTIDGLSPEILTQLDREICRMTTEVMSVRLPSDDTPYHHLAAWAGGVTRAHPIEVFTSNYDLLTEEALEKQQVPYFDGFVGSDRTFFDLPSMEQDVLSTRDPHGLPARWARLWKVHGSINWWKTASGHIERHVDLHDGAQQMIHPSHLKYDESRRMPYLAMLDRLRSFLLRGQAVLVTCGYSFSDRHLNDVILQGLTGNSSAICFGLLFGARAKYRTAVKAARSRANLTLLAEDGAVFNTIERDWHSDDKSEHPLCGIAAEGGSAKVPGDSPAQRCRFLLGDFSAFGGFLARQLSNRQDGSEGNNAK